MYSSTYGTCNSVYATMPLYKSGLIRGNCRTETCLGNKVCRVNCSCSPKQSGSRALSRYVCFSVARPWPAASSRVRHFIRLLLFCARGFLLLVGGLPHNSTSHVSTSTMWTSYRGRFFYLEWRRRRIACSTACCYVLRFRTYCLVCEFSARGCSAGQRP